MKPNFYPGNLIITVKGKFYVFDQVSLRGDGTVELGASAGFMTNDSERTSQKRIGIIVSCARTVPIHGQLGYVIFPEMIGWLFDHNVETLMRG